MSFSDAPYSLITSVLEAIPQLTGTESTGFDFTLFTGDMLAHDPDNQQSRYAFHTCCQSFLTFL
jgi:sphingomyelin phosphodiesterase